MKSRFYVATAILLSICTLLGGCGKQNDTSRRSGKEFKGKPMYYCEDHCEPMKQLGLKDPWVDELVVDSAFQWTGSLKGGQYFTVVCRLNDEVCKKNDFSKDSRMKAYCFEYDEDFEWKAKNAVFKEKGEYFVYDDTAPNGDDLVWEGFKFAMEIPVSIVPGSYTIAFVRDDTEVEYMLNFIVEIEDDMVYDDPGYDDYEYAAKKPVIYLYPETETDVSVSVDFDGEMVCTYPEYGNGWNVTAFPDGRLFDKNTERYYDYLFWDGMRSFADYEFKSAACVASEDTAAFLEEYLTAAGLNDREIDDFISFWLPELQKSPYNLISFPSDEYCEWAKLHVDPMPDTIIRVYMVYKPLDSRVDIPQDMQLQMPSPVTRQGFTLVDWGGTEL